MDEITTIQRASLPLGKMLANSIFFHQLPAYFIVTSWMLPFGTNETAIRLPAVLFGALSCALGFGIARALGGNRAGVAAGLLLALAPEQVQYGQEARSYTMVICAILVAFWGLVVLAQDPAAAALRWRSGSARRGAWAAYTLGTVAALNVLSVALLWFVAANLAAVAVAERSRDRRGFWLNWTIAQALIVLLAAPWFVAMKLFGQRGAMGGLDWVPKLTPARFWWALNGTYLLQPTSLITVRSFPGGVPGAGLLAVCLAVAGAVAPWRRQPAVLAVVGAAILILPLGLLAISLVYPVWMPRYLIWSAAPFFVCAGLGVTLLPVRTQWPAVAVLGVLLAVNLRPYYHDETKPRWDIAGQELHAGLRPGELVLTNDPQAISMMNLYLACQHTALPAQGWTLDVHKAAAALATGHSVWAVQGLVGQADHETQAQFLRRIAMLGQPAETEHAGLDIILLRFDPPVRHAGDPAH
jgi:mannosyltransferase